jgi:hypothetical protein
MAGGAAMKAALLLSLGLMLVIAPAAAQIAPAGPAEMISAFRQQNGQGVVKLDSTLTGIAHDQAEAMAAKDVLDHDVLGKFSNRVAKAKAGAAAENIAYGYDGFPKTLEQWINSSGHRKNLLLRDATRVGVASARSAATKRTYWAMVIAGGYEPPAKKDKAKQEKAKPAADAKPVSGGKPPKAAAKHSCGMRILGVCLY